MGLPTETCVVYVERGLKWKLHFLANTIYKNSDWSATLKDISAIKKIIIQTKWPKYAKHINSGNTIEIKSF
jgi:hypothetical protein